MYRCVEYVNVRYFIRLDCIILFVFFLFNSREASQFFLVYAGMGIYLEMVRFCLFFCCMIRGKQVGIVF